MKPLRAFPYGAGKKYSDPYRRKWGRQEHHSSFHFRTGQGQQRKIEFQGEDITGKSPEEIVSRGITLVPEGRKIFPDLTVLENLRIGAYLRKDDLTDDLNKVYDLFPRLKERSWQLGATLSGGEQQMLAVGRALMSRPKL